jgi:CxxC motif-containing protein (DUF1111 family)
MLFLESKTFWGYLCVDLGGETSSMRPTIISLVMLVGLGANPAAALESQVPLLDLSGQDTWQFGEVNYGAEYNLWAWQNFGQPVDQGKVVLAAFSADEATVFSNTGESFSAPIFTLEGKTLRAFAFGRHLFRRHWTNAPDAAEGFDGLGPTFNRISCSGCHTRDGRGRPPASTDEPMKSMLVRLSVPGVAENGGPVPHPLYGLQLQDKAIPGVPEEGRATIRYRDIEGSFADGQPYRLRAPVYTFTDMKHGPLGNYALFSPRVAPATYGLGLLEAVDEAAIAAAADPDDVDGDGISGAVNRVWNPATGNEQLGRFGWKANTASLYTQIAAAAHGDMGITSSLFPTDNCTAVQTACLAVAGTAAPEIDDQSLHMLAIYARSLSVPARRDPNNPKAQRGQALFESVGCAACHTPTLTTGQNTILPELAGQTIHPYTDLLLHDMGEGLADGRPDFLASGQEWRTSPLWGIGLVQRVNLHRRFLHDGRAEGLMEAVLWHGGEAKAARDAVIAMSKADRDALLVFLRSL